MIRYLCAENKLRFGEWAILGAPLDETGSYRRGAGKGPDAVRAASDSLEEYCPVLDNDLSDCHFADIGNISLPKGDLEGSQKAIAEAVAEVFSDGAKPLMLGGEHSVSMAAIRETAHRYEDLCVVQFDAHADLRDSYDDTPLSHACVMRRVLEDVPSYNMFQVGIRSGTREEWTWMREHRTIYPATPEAVKSIVETISGRPVYLTIDLDILDPSIVPGTGTPEPGGVSYAVFEKLLLELRSLNLVAADVVELAPELDPSGVSAVVAAKIVRSLLLF